MTKEIVLELITILASLATLISIAYNIYQSKMRKNMINICHTFLFSAYNHMYRIAEIRGEASVLFGEISKTPEFVPLVEYFGQIRGIADSARTDILSFAEKYLNKQIKRQHPAQPEEISANDRAVRY